jgi:HlyD family secretion protein
MKAKRCETILALLLVLLASITGGCASSAKNGDEETVEIVHVERGSLLTSITAVGSIRPGAEVVLSFEVSGRVTEVLIQAGDQVRPGQPLAVLDTADLELQVQSAEAALVAAQAQLAQIEAVPRVEEIHIAEGQLAAAQAALDQAIAQRDQLITGTKDSEIVVARTQLDSAQARVRQLQRQLEQVRAQDSAPEVAIAQIEVERAKIALDETQDEYNKALDRPWEDQEIRDAWAKELEQARLNYRQAQAQLDRALNNQKAHIISLGVLAAQIEEAETGLDASQVQLIQAEDSLEPRQRSAEAAVAAARAQRDIAQAQLDLLLAGATEAEIAAARANVDQVQVTLDSALLALERATLRAPFDGTVAQVDVDPGKFASPQVRAVTLVNDKQFSIEADIDEADIGWLQAGQDVQITLDAFPGHDLAGNVVAILPSATQDLGVVSYRVTIAIAPTDLPLRSGMTANTEIIRDRREDVLLIPNRAIWIDAQTGQTFVEKSIDEGQPGAQVVVVDIEQGLANEEFSEVLAGLKEGDRLIVRSASIRDRFRDVVTMPMTGQ